MLSASLAKVVKKAAQIADLMTGEDVEADLKVLRDAKKATHHVYDTKKKKLVKVPDHKTRLAATTLSRAYHEGKPVERSISLQGDVDDFAAMLEKARNSPAALEALQNTVLAHETVPTLEDSQIGGPG
jgi:ribosomal protein L22